MTELTAQEVQTIVQGAVNPILNDMQNLKSEMQSISSVSNHGQVFETLRRQMEDMHQRTQSMEQTLLDIGRYLKSIDEVLRAQAEEQSQRGIR